MKTIMWVAAISTLLIAVGAFVLSFNSLSQYAVENKVSVPFLVPLVLELSVIGFSFTALYFSLSGERDNVFRLLVAVISGIAVIFNISHAPGGVMSRLMYAMPSILLVINFESFIYLIKHKVSISDLINTLSSVRSELSDKESLLKSITSEVSDYQNQLSDYQAKVSTLTEDYQQKVCDLENDYQKRVDELSKNPVPLSDNEIQAYQIDGMLFGGMTQTAISKALGISQATVSNRIKSLNGNSLLHKVS